MSDLCNRYIEFCMRIFIQLNKQSMVKNLLNKSKTLNGPDERESKEKDYCT